MSSSSSSSDVALGIDIGSCTSCVALYRNGLCEVIANENGYRSTPSVIAFVDDEAAPLVGESAEKHTILPQVIPRAKRLLGLEEGDSRSESFVSRQSYGIEFRSGGAVEEGPVTVTVNWKDTDKKYTAPELLRFVIERMKATANDYHGSSIKNAVVAYPAYFNEKQIKGLHKAATDAGLNVLRLINEHIAALLSLDFDRSERSASVMVVDVGADRVTATAVSLVDGLFAIRGSATRWGEGSDRIDDALVDHFVMEFKRKYRGTEPTENKKSMRRLRGACIQAKHILSTTNTANIEVDSMYEGIDYFTSCTRAKLESLIGGRTSTWSELIIAVVKAAGWCVDDVSHIVLVGAACKAPFVTDLIKSIFPNLKNEILKNSPDEMIAVGCALESSFLLKYGGKTNEPAPTKSVSYPILSKSIGVEVSGGWVLPLVQKGTRIPCSTSRLFTIPLSSYATAPLNADQEQYSIAIRLYEGERPIASQNTKLSSLVLDGACAASDGLIHCEIEIEIESDGSMIIEVTDQATHTSTQLEVKANDGGKENISESSIDEKADEEERSVMTAMQAIEAECRSLIVYHRKQKSDTEKRDNVDDDDDDNKLPALKHRKWTSEEMSQVESLVKDIHQWITSIHNSSSHKKEIVLQKQQEVHSIYASLMHGHTAL